MSEGAQTGAARGQGDVPPPLEILVVDDNPDAADSLATLLTEFGHSVKRAYDGRTALLLASQFRPRLVFLDIVMPKMDGLELARTIRDIPGLAAIPVVAVSGHGDDEMRDMARMSGFDAFLVKPVTTASIRSLSAANV